MQDVWCIPPAMNAAGEENLASSLGVPTHQLRTRLTASAALKP